MAGEGAPERRHPDAADIAAVLPWTVVRAGRQMERMVAERVAGHDLTPVQFGVLAHLSATPGLNQSELARAVQVRQQSAREVALTLIERGLVRRTGPDGRGHRSGLELTGTGRTLLSRAWPDVAGIDAAALGLAAGEDVRLNRLLAAVLDASAGRH